MSTTLTLRQNFNSKPLRDYKKGKFTIGDRVRIFQVWFNFKKI